MRRLGAPFVAPWTSWPSGPYGPSPGIDVTTTYPNQQRAGTLLVALQFALIAAPAWLGAVLTAKADIEERWMLLEHPGYAACRARAWRFVPGLS